ncbi:peptide/nickel transport system ATP-binding protein [Actinoalloteichus hoggarensis]|uniref:Oligopeptide transport ATP-binding protein OppD n=1 Tax=Actinoalloteichus hoggarensis TaxID=1470176 RepID=A0A221VX75_9PSEU|nr:ABC transporter ATP-binding protein [Actinoalloteichus hoggarensis]ASO17851.1 Oligopeptide transport ATP-binding protein OppD [Actinoalloteichus hoggarensis]MBB5924263.1 peptide/nickel transport system ATP-binding protein [Actinoalloteichus hoggarensis]
MSRIVDVEDLQIELVTADGVVRAVDGVSLHIDAGETVTLIGESGSGKSTTAMGLLRLLPAELAVLSGRAMLAGHDVVADPASIAALRGRVVGLIPQDPMTALSPVETIGRRLTKLVRLRDPGTGRQAARARAAALLESVRVPDPAWLLDRYPHQLSGGLQQRVLIACALTGEPELLVADEPTSALDVTVQAGVLDLLMELQERTGVAILMITHDIGVARLVSDRVHVMRAGRFVESGDVEEVVDAPRHPYTRQLLASVPRLVAKEGRA